MTKSPQSPALEALYRVNASAQEVVNVPCALNRVARKVALRLERFVVNAALIVVAIVAVAFFMVPYVDEASARPIDFVSVLKLSAFIVAFCAWFWFISTWDKSRP